MLVKKIKSTSMINDETHILCNQVNCKGTLTGEIGHDIAKKYKKIAKEYYDYCEKNNFSRDMMGDVLFTDTSECVVANYFGQYSYGASRKLTNYVKVKDAFIKIRQFAEEYDVNTVTIPYGMGCIDGGGKWDRMMNIIRTVFHDTQMIIRIVGVPEEENEN